MYRNKLSLLVFLCLFCISGYGQKIYYVSTLAGDTAGLSIGLDSNAGYRDGAAATALFNGPTGITVDTAGENVYIADTYNNIIRKINITSQTVTTIAGDTADIKFGLDSNLGYQNGAAMSAKFSNPYGICVDDSGNVYVADTYNNVIRKIWKSTGMVTTYAGKDSSGITFAGFVNGPDSAAEFFTPTSLTIDTAGNIYVADEGNNAIRKISTTGIVSTMAGKGPDTTGSPSYINGPVDTAQFYSLFGIACQSNGAILVSQFANGVNAIRRLYQDTVTTYSGYDTIGFDTNMFYWSPTGIPSGYENGYQGIYQNGIDTDAFGDTIYYIAKGILYNSPTGIGLDSGNLLVADEYNNVIRMMNANNLLVTTLAGNDTIGFRNGWDSLAEFYNPVGVTADKKGNVYVADLGNNVVRKIALQSITGISTIKKPVNSLSVYPNPCTGRLTIVSSFNGSASLSDVTGRVVWTNNNFISPYNLSISGISPGIYFLKITSSAATVVKKIEVVK
jgi:hypothetical protein